MKKTKLFFVTCFIFLMGFFIIPTGKTDAQAATRTRLNYTSVKIAQGKSRQIKVLGRRGRKVTWTSNNPNVATVKRGKITALKGGKATITAKIGSKRLKCRVTSVGLNATKLTLSKGNRVQLKVKNGKNTKWSSTNEEILRVSKNGSVKAVKEGGARIVCRTNGKKLVCKIYVAKIERTSLRLTAEREYRLKVQYTGGSVRHWYSSNPSVASVDQSGNITAQTVSGVSTITCKSGKAVLRCNVTVVSPDNIYTNMNLLPLSSKGDRYTVTVNSYPNMRNYTVYKQSADINASSFKKYMSRHGCAASALATVLTGFGKNVVPKQITDENGLEYRIFGAASWKKNYKEKYNDDQDDDKSMPVSLYGINKILNRKGIRTEYVRRFEKAEAASQITRHLKTGNPVVIEMKKGRWANSFHTMVLLGITNTGKAIIADSADRADTFGNQRRIKYETVNNLLDEGMFSCTASGASSTNCYFSTAGGGGYILVNPDVQE